MTNRELEKGLREEWEKWQAKAHPDDRMSFVDYVDEWNGQVFKGHKVVIERDRYGDIEIMFYPVN